MPKISNGFYALQAASQTIEWQDSSSSDSDDNAAKHRENIEEVCSADSQESSPEPKMAPKGKSSDDHRSTGRLHSVDQTSPVISSRRSQRRVRKPCETSEIMITPHVTEPPSSPVIKSVKTGRQAGTKRKLADLLGSDSSTDDNTPKRRVSDKHTPKEEEQEEEEVTLVPESPEAQGHQSDIIDSNEEYEQPTVKPPEKTSMNIYRSLLNDASLSSSCSISIGSESFTFPWGGSPALTPASTDSQLTGLERDLLDGIRKSNKKRKLIPKGFAKRFESDVRMLKSRKSIQRHVLRRMNTTPTDYRDLNVKSIRIIATVVSIQCENSSGNVFTLLVNLQFFKKSLNVGDTMRVEPPWTVLNLHKRRVVLGINDWEVIKTADHQTDRCSQPMSSQSSHHQSNAYDVHYSCNCSEKELAFCDVPDKFQCLINFENAKRRNSGNITMKKFVPSAVLRGRKVRSVPKLVERFGSCSASPQPFSQTSTLPMVELKILQPIRCVRNIHNPMFPVPLTEVETSFVAQDKENNFVHVVIDTEVGENPREWRPFLEGSWSGLPGSTVLVAGLFPQNRTNTRRSKRLTGIFARLNKPTQRIYYTLKAYTCTRLKFLKRPKTSAAMKRLSDPDLYSAGPRVNLRCVLLHFDEETATMFVHDTKRVDQPLKQIHCSKEAYVPPPSLYPCLLNMFGVNTGPGTQLSLDHYSGCMPVKQNVEIPYPSLVPHLAQSPVPGSLVRINGKIDGVVPEECEQWLSCSECASQKILIEERECFHCHSTSIKNRMTLVLKISGFPVKLLEERAISLLRSLTASRTTEDQHSFGMINPDQILGMDIDLVCLVLEPFFVQVQIK